MTSVCIVYPFDPFGRKVGGIQTFLRGFISHAPEDFEIKHLGVTTDPVSRPVGTPLRLTIGGRSIHFLGALHDGAENTRSLIPLSLRFTLAAMRWNSWCRDSVLLFNRIEPALAFHRHRSPKIGFVHNDIPQVLAAGSEGSWRHAPRLYEWTERHLMKHFDMLYTVNGNTLRLYAQRYPDRTDHIAFLPTWVDDDVFAPSAIPKRELRLSQRFSEPLPTDVPWLLFVGRFQHQKDPFLLVDSFAEMRKRGCTAILLLVGEGNLRAEVATYATQMGVRDKMYFLGAMEQSTLARLYQCADLLLVTSRFEGMPRAPLEAVGSGLPVVTTRAGEVARFVLPGRTGELVDERTSIAFATAALRALAERTSYTSEACLNSVAAYRPAAVLQPVYDRIRQLAQQSGIDVAEISTEA